MPESFETWFQITNLHVWILACRFRALQPPLGKAYIQHLLNVFFEDIEARMRLYGVKYGTVVARFSRDLLHKYHGTALSYEEGLIKGDTAMAAALWRNLLNCSPLIPTSLNLSTQSSSGDTAEGVIKVEIKSEKASTVWEAEARTLESITVLVEYIHRELQRVDKVPDKYIESSSISIGNFGPIRT